MMKQPGEPQKKPDGTDYMACASCFCLASRQAARKITRLYDSHMQESYNRVILRAACRDARQKQPAQAI